ncbi:MAG: RNB domain-containing ribonuclease, partial [Planctomycetota bacterium]
QSQAAYVPENIGHFGLALSRYAHFTSPIRRYADLLVHRALVAGLGLGRDGLPREAGAGFAEAGQHISATERRAQAAEREAVDRFTAAFLQDQLGKVASGRIAGVTRFGLFVTLDESGADGLVPISTLPDDFYDHDEAGHRLVGRRWRRTYRLGETVFARLTEADPITGGLVLNLVEDELAGEPAEAPRDGSADTRGWDPLPAERRPGRRNATGSRAKAGRGSAGKKSRKKGRSR